MFCLTAMVRTQPGNPEHGVFSDSYMAAWIVAESEELAMDIARRDIKANDWELIDFEEISDCDDETYADDDANREYYELAKTDSTVYVYYNCPKYPVFYFELQIFQPPKAVDENDANGDEADENDIAEVNTAAITRARGWILNETVCDLYDAFEPDFWTGERLERALSIVTDAINDNGFSVVNVIQQNPVSPDEIGSDEKFYDATEEDGLCVMLVQNLG